MIRATDKIQLGTKIELLSSFSHKQPNKIVAIRISSGEKILIRFYNFWDCYSGINNRNSFSQNTALPAAFMILSMIVFAQVDMTIAG